ncbi:MAG TPA: hypothetical protein VHO67_21325, partial [Polyangia bacterium]|nr:hypothetical protein [Polyangia bacterium]
GPGGGGPRGGAFMRGGQGPRPGGEGPSGGPRRDAKGWPIADTSSVDADQAPAAPRAPAPRPAEPQGAPTPPSTEPTKS